MIITLGFNKKTPFFIILVETVQISDLCIGPWSRFALFFSEQDNFELDENDMNGVVNEVVGEDKKGVFANRNPFNALAQLVKHFH
jgi:hypothetical protein